MVDKNGGFESPSNKYISLKIVCYGAIYIPCGRTRPGRPVQVSRKIKTLNTVTCWCSTNAKKTNCMLQTLIQQPLSHACAHSFVPLPHLNPHVPLRTRSPTKRAGLEGLEECPWCEWKCVMEARRDQYPLSRCGNEGVMSCRLCRKKDYMARSCREVERLDGRHTIEEAMSAFLLGGGGL